MQQSFRLQAFHLFDVTFLTTHSLLCETFNQFTRTKKRKETDDVLTAVYFYLLLLSVKNLSLLITLKVVHQ